MLVAGAGGRHWHTSPAPAPNLVLGEAFLSHAIITPVSMILFVTSADLPFIPGQGGTEAFTIGVIRQLRKRGMDARIATVGLRKRDGRALVPDVPFNDYATIEDLAAVDATLINVCRPHSIAMRKPSFVMMHVPPRSSAYSIREYKAASQRHSLIANSKFTQHEWARQLGLDPAVIDVVYPFADPAFAAVERPAYAGDDIRVMFAGRLSAAKGIYLLLEAMHHPVLKKGFTFTVTASGDSTPDGKLIKSLLSHHPAVQLVDAQESSQDMASLMARHDIVVMPSNHQFWQEAFGMVSVEAQHAGCRVVASNAAGLPETDCGGLQLFEAGNSLALAEVMAQAAERGSPSPQARRKAATHFTLESTVNSLLQLIGQP